MLEKVAMLFAPTFPYTLQSLSLLLAHLVANDRRYRPVRLCKARSSECIFAEELQGPRGWGEMTTHSIKLRVE